MDLRTDGAQCTANFVVFDDLGEVYLSQAAHCGSGGDRTETDGCVDAPPSPGTQVTIDGASEPGTLVYNS